MAAEPQHRRLFGRDRRLKQAREFSRVKQHGRRMVQGCLIANWMVLAPEATSRLGVITTKKLGNAVVRSRVRRLMREAFRLHQYDLTLPVDLVLVAQRTIVGKGFAAVESDLLTVLRKARLLKE